MRQRIVIIVGTVGLLVALATAGTALGLAARGLSRSSIGADCNSTAPKLTVQGTGMATATPNLLTVSVGIDVTDPSAQASLADDNSKASAVTTALKQGGILVKDVQTSDLSIQPHYGNGGSITGYEVTNTLTAKLRDFTDAGSVIDDLVGAAGNAARIDSLTFSVEDPRAMEDQARGQAVHQAVSHARSMAQAAGERLGPVCSLSDASPIAPSPLLQYGLGASGAAAGNSAQVPLQPGTQQASAQVTIVYALRTAESGT